VRLILLTHGHVDHAGSAAALQGLTGARIAIHYRDQELLEKGQVVAPRMWNAGGRVIDRALARITRHMHSLRQGRHRHRRRGLSLGEFGIHGRSSPRPDIPGAP